MGTPGRRGSDVKTIYTYEKQHSINSFSYSHTQTGIATDIHTHTHINLTPSAGLAELGSLLETDADELLLLDDDEEGVAARLDAAGDAGLVHAIDDEERGGAACVVA